MWKCPRCREKIDQLNYNVSTEGREYGTAYLSGQKENTDIIEDYECQDSENGDWKDDMTYDCPECDAEINKEDLIWEEKEEEEEEEESEPEETQHSIIEPKDYITSNSESKTAKYSLICKHCFHVYVHSMDYTSDEFCDCPKCGEPNSKEEFNKLLKEDFFNKKHVKSKNKH